MTGKRPRTCLSSRPIASTLDVVGDRRTLLLIRDIGLFDEHRNEDFRDAAEGIPSNVLASRLQRLVERGLRERRLYQARPLRYDYHLTPVGKGLLPVLGAKARWGIANIEGVEIPEPMK